VHVVWPLLAASPHDVVVQIVWRVNDGGAMDCMEECGGVVVEVEGKVLVCCPLRKDFKAVDDQVNLPLFLAWVETVELRCLDQGLSI
jgi:hypothetical protein